MKIDYDLLGKLASEYEYEFQVEDFYGKLVAWKLNKEFGVYVGFNESSNTFMCKAIDFNVDMRDISSYKELYDMLSSRLDSNYDDIRLVDKYLYFMEDVGINEKFGELKDMSRDFNTHTFLDFLWYIRTGEFVRDLSIGSRLMRQAQDYADEYGKQDSDTLFYPSRGLRHQIRYGKWIDLTTVDEKFNGITMKFFQNGKILIKGLSTDEWESIIHIKEMCKGKH